MTETVEQSELEGETKRRAEDRRLIRRMQKKVVLKVLSGTLAGLAILIPGLVFFSPLGILLVFIGLIVIIAAIFGGLYIAPSFLLAREEVRERAEREQENRERAKGERG